MLALQIHCIVFDLIPVHEWRHFQKVGDLYCSQTLKPVEFNDKWIKMRLISCFIYFILMSMSPTLNAKNYLYFKYCKRIYQIIFFGNFYASICSSFVAWRHQVSRFLIEQFDRAQAPSCTTIDLDFTSRLDSNYHSSFIFFLLKPLVSDVLIYFSSLQ